MMKIAKRTFISDFLLSCNDVFMMLLYCEILEIKKKLWTRCEKPVLLPTKYHRQRDTEQKLSKKPTYYTSWKHKAKNKPKKWIKGNYKNQFW